ncbi:MAG: branched-chain amino acid ABC transporter substrate-binding protein [Chloroflexota bacterium]|nr:MAG: branched-chain amino acid ABC transporter substrate-binding protein [Chloroflexota bacterium]
MDNSYYSLDKKRGWLGFMLVILALALAACQTGQAASEGPAVKEGPITIGVSLPLTGRRGESGMAAKNGYEVWVEMVNGTGGLLGRKIELKVLDNSSEEDKAAADYEKLIVEDKVDLVVGTQSSVLVIPTSKVAADHGYAYVEPAGGAPEVFDRGLKNIFFAQPAQSARQADPFALYVLGLPASQRPQTFAIVNMDDPFALGIMERLKGLLTDGGLKLVFETTYPPETQDFSDIAGQVAQLDPDLILGGTQFEDSVGQIKAYQAAKYQPRFAFFTSGPALPGPFKSTLGSATEGIFSAVSWFPETNDFQNRDFVTKYVEKFGGSLGDIPEDAANAFTVGQVLQQAVEKIQSIDNTALIEELHRGTYKTIVGPLSFDEVGKPQGNYMLLQWQGDNFVIVGPRDRAEKDPLQPPKAKW